MIAEGDTPTVMDIDTLLAEADALMAEAPDEETKEFLLLLRGWIVDLKEPHEV